MADKSNHFIKLTPRVVHDATIEWDRDGRVKGRLVLSVCDQQGNVLARFALSKSAVARLGAAATAVVS